MPTARRGRGGRGREPEETSAPPSQAATDPPMPGTTGRYLVLLEPGQESEVERAMRDGPGIRMSSIGETDATPVGEDAVPQGDGVIMRELGVAVVNMPPDQLSAMSTAVAASSAMHGIEAERHVFAFAEADPAYLRGYRDGVDDLGRRLAGRQPSTPDGPAAEATTFDTSRDSWGLQATRVPSSRFTGKDIKVAILDTGLDLSHPDFIGRNVISQSFVPGATVQDGNGHGTHCAGIACGPLRPRQLPRYGVACGADLLIAKVLNDAGRGVDGDIIAGLRWAIASGAQIISMSLGAPVAPGQSYSAVFEQIGRRAADAGALIIAAAGNDSRRQQGVVNPVGHPANCPSIMAVAAVDRAMQPGWFSNGGRMDDGGKVDIAAPGVDIVSAWLSPQLYKSEDGTSMATPHVAGIAALFAQATATDRGLALWSRLIQRGRPLAASSRDVGIGLVQAP